MTKNNDTRILELKKQIQKKKDELGGSKRFNPITNCSLNLRGNRINLNTLNESEMKWILIDLNSILLSAEDLGMENVELSGYKLEEWITDVKAKLEVFVHRAETAKLAQMEEKLVKLLSEGKKVELEIDEIESFLK